METQTPMAQAKEALLMATRTGEIPMATLMGEILMAGEEMTE